MVVAFCHNSQLIIPVQLKSIDTILETNAIYFPDMYVVVFRGNLIISKEI